MSNLWWRISNWRQRRANRRAGRRLINFMLDRPTLAWQRDGHTYVGFCTSIGWIGGSLTAKCFAEAATFEEFAKRAGAHHLLGRAREGGTRQ